MDFIRILEVEGANPLITLPNTYGLICDCEPCGTYPLYDEIGRLGFDGPTLSEISRVMFCIV